MIKQITIPRINAIILTFFCLTVAAAIGVAQPGERLSPTAKADFQKGNYDSCVSEYTVLIAAQPKNDSFYAERSRCHYLKVSSLTNAEANAEINFALIDATKSLDLNPKNAAALNVRGLVKAYKKDENGAIADFSKVIEIDPKSQKAYFNRATSKINLSDSEGAIADYTKLIEINPQFTQIYINRGRLYYRLRKKAEAIADYSKAIEIDPQNKQAADALASISNTAGRTSTASTGCVSGNCVNGYGKYIFDNGFIYEGSFVNSNLQGQGTFTYKDVGVYTGQFANGLRHGQGKFSYLNGDIYEGSWITDKTQGQGTFTLKNGDYYVGKWENDKRNGYGKQYYKSTNTVQEGTWKDSVFVNSTATSAATTLTADALNIESEAIAKVMATFKELAIKNGEQVVAEGIADKLPPFSTNSGQMSIGATNRYYKLFVISDDPSFDTFFFRDGQFMKTPIDAGTYYITPPKITKLSDKFNLYAIVMGFNNEERRIRMEFHGDRVGKVRYMLLSVKPK